MTEHTLTVPGEYAEDFRLALVEEIAFQARAVKDNRAELVRRRFMREEPQPGDDADVRGALKLLRQDGELAAQVSMEALTEPFEVQVDDLATVQHAFETMVRSVVGPRLAEELDTSPLDTGQVERLRALMEELRWTVEQAGEFHARWQAEHEVAA